MNTVPRGLLDRIKYWLKPNKEKHCHGCCLNCPYYTVCTQDTEPEQAA